MRFRLAAVIAIGLALSGCVLESKAPVFGDDESELILGATPATYKPFQRTPGGRWIVAHTMEPDMRLTPQGRHYLATQLGSTDARAVAFAALGDGWFAAQMIDSDDSTIYALAKPDGRDLLIRVLACDQLKAIVAGDAVVFGSSSCKIRPGADARALFRALADGPGEAELKFARVR